MAGGEVTTNGNSWHVQRRRRWRRSAAALAASCALATAGGCGAAAPHMPAAAAVSFPDTPAGRQARWLVSAAAHPPIPASQITAHLDQAFLAKVTPAGLDSTLVLFKGIHLDSVAASTPDDVVFIATASQVTKVKIGVSVDARGLISGLELQPAGNSPSAPTAPVPPLPVPATWAGVDTNIRSVAPAVRFLAASVTASGCTPIQGIDANTPAPLGSSFKLYVLDALAAAIAAGKVSWNQQLTITSQVKSGGSGILRADPDGTRLAVQQVASDMIAVSDNTAADMLIGLLGRAAVEKATRTSGIADPALDVPFLTTREQFILKLDDWPKLADRYLALGPAGRARFLAQTVDHIQLGLNTPAWTQPRDINSIEWFASPADICRLYASLAGLARQPKLAPVASILARNPGAMGLSVPGGLGLSPRQWQSVWYKGGSEPGVMTLNYLATTRTGRTYVVSVLTENPSRPLPAQAQATLNNAIKGAFELAALSAPAT